MKVKTELFFLSVEEKVSKSTNQPYQAINFIDDKDNKFFAMGNGLSFDGIKKFDKVFTDLEITLGQFTRVEVLNIRKAG